MMKAMTIIPGLVLAISLPGLVLGQDDADSPEALFQSLDKNEDGVLAPEEIPDEQGRFFDRLVRIGDEDDNGKLSQDEFVQALTREDAPVGANQRNRGNRNQPRAIPIADLFERLDAGKKENMSLDELPEQAGEGMRPLFDQFGKEELTREDFEEIRDRYARGAMNVNQLRQALQRMDSNEDGKVDLEEVPEQARRRMQPLFDRLDTDSIELDGLAEKLQAMAQQRDGRRDPENPRGRRPESENRDRPRGTRDRSPLPIFRVFDTHGHPVPSKAELEAAAEKFDELDRNGDGRLDPPELFGGPPRDGRRPEGRDRRPESERPRRPPADDNAEARTRERRQGEFDIDAFIGRFDKDDDDAISEDEAPERMKENFARIDADGDGKLTRAEITKIRSRNQRPQRRRENPEP